MRDPAWVAGISIGAINAALIVGNAPEDRVMRLREFWEMVTVGSKTAGFGMGAFVDALNAFSRPTPRGALNESSANRGMLCGVPGFFSPRFPPTPFQARGTLEAISYYDSKLLKATLERLIDFDRIIDGVSESGAARDVRCQVEFHVDEHQGCDGGEQALETDHRRHVRERTEDLQPEGVHEYRDGGVGVERDEPVEGDADEKHCRPSRT